MLLKDIELKEDVRKIRPDATAKDAIELFAKTDIPLVLVEKKNTSDTYGIVTKSDIINNVIGKGVDPEKVTVDSLASKPLIIVNNLEIDVTWLAKRMAHLDISNIAIFDGGELKGFVTDMDILRAHALELKQKEKT
jgi:predicted transcriptional regulator